MANTRSIPNATALRDENMLRRVRYLGSARDGLAEWRLQRRTALALIPLGFYFVASMLRLATSDQTTAAAWLASPVPALLTILFVLALLAHAVVGLRSVLVDYVHTRARLVAAELLVRAAAVVPAGASVRVLCPRRRRLCPRRSRPARRSRRRRSGCWSAGRRPGSGRQ